MPLAIDKGFLKDLGKLEKPVYNRVTEVFDEFDAATHTGLHLEKIANARNPRFRSIRIDQAWRGIVLAPVTGDVYTLLKVLHHDDAYAWAQCSNVSVNSATGGIEIRDETELERQIPEMTEAAKNAGTPVFANVKDGELTKLGIDEKVLAFARNVTDAAQLDAAKSFLPETQWDVLFGLAAGFTPEEVWADLGAQILSEPVDTDDIDAAILRSSDRVVLVSGPDELMDVFAYPFATWRVYLHPTQRAVVDAAYKGPARVTGGPGTGKTVVALHRARMLAQRGDGKVLVTTFTSTLSETLQSGLDILVDDEKVEERIEVSHVDRIAHRVFRNSHGAPHMLGSEDEKALWAGLIDELGLTFTPVFLSEEWRQVVLARRIGTADAYLAAKRTGRGRALERPSGPRSGRRSGSSSRLSPSRARGHTKPSGGRRLDYWSNLPTSRSATSSSTRPRTSARTNGGCCAPRSPKHPTTSSSPAILTNAFTTTGSACAKSASRSPAGRRD